VGVSFNKENKMADIVYTNGLLLFWRSWPSNWTPSPFVIHNQRFNCVEQYMMAEKAALFGDMDTYQKILSTDVPKEQQQLGRAVKNYSEPHWVQVRFSLVLRGTLEKYRQNPQLKEKLMGIDHKAIFVEASPVDKVWGIGLAADDPKAHNQSTWEGLNVLGQVVTTARDILLLEGK
jgi:hypothetical protein